MWSNTLVTRLGAVAAVLAVAFAVAYASADTWHLKQGGNWEQVADDASGKYTLAVAKVKQLINAGEVEPAQEALEKLKTDFPDIIGPDLDAFIEAEMLYAQGKWAKAVKKYDEFIDTWPGSWLRDSAMERQYSIAVAFLNGEKRRVMKVLKLSAYGEGAKIMWRIADRSGDAPIAKRALVTLAKSYETRGKFYAMDPDEADAYKTWEYISSRWGTGQIGKEALLGMAHSLHSAYKGPKYDVDVLVSTERVNAQNLYETFRSQNLELFEQYNIDAKITMLNEQTAYKQFTIARYYDRTDSKQAADIYYRFVIDNWPDTDAAKMAKAKLDAAQESEQPESSAKDKRKLGRRLFDTGTAFLDSWFGISKLKGQNNPTD